MVSEQTLNPSGGVCNRRGVEEQTSNSQLLERILTPENVQKAWKRVRANKGVPGVDGIIVDEFSEFLCEKLFKYILEVYYTSIFNRKETLTRDLIARRKRLLKN